MNISRELLYFSALWFLFGTFYIFYLFIEVFTLLVQSALLTLVCIFMMSILNTPSNKLHFIRVHFGGFSLSFCLECISLFLGFPWRSVDTCVLDKTAAFPSLHGLAAYKRPASIRLARDSGGVSNLYASLSDLFLAASRHLENTRSCQLSRTSKTKAGSSGSKVSSLDLFNSVHPLGEVRSWGISSQSYGTVLKEELWKFKKRSWIQDLLNFPTSFSVDGSVLTQRSGASQRISVKRNLSTNYCWLVVFVWGRRVKSFLFWHLVNVTLLHYPSPQMKVLEEMILVVPSSYRRLWKSKDMVLLPSHNLPHKPNYVSPSFLLPWVLISLYDSW